MTEGIDLDETVARGVGALARAADGHWVMGHCGAALLAGVWLLREGSLPDASAAALARRLSETIEGDPARYALPGVGAEVGSGALVDALREHIGGLRNGAHGTIYAAAALRALAERPELATHETVQGIVWLYRNAQDPDPDRYYGIADHEHVEIRSPDTSETVDAAALILDSFAELDRVYPDQQIDGRRYFFAGEKLHLVTHAHALVWLEALGHDEIARSGFAAHGRQLVLTRQKPPGGVEPFAPASHGPEDPAFWAVHGDPWHDIKFAHAVSELMTRLDAAQQGRVRPLLGAGWAATV